MVELFVLVADLLSWLVVPKPMVLDLAELELFVLVAVAVVDSVFPKQSMELELGLVEELELFVLVLVAVAMVDSVYPKQVLLGLEELELVH